MIKIVVRFSCQRPGFSSMIRQESTHGNCGKLFVYADVNGHLSQVTREFLIRFISSSHLTFTSWFSLVTLTSTEMLIKYTDTSWNNVELFSKLLLMTSILGGKIEYLELTSPFSLRLHHKFFYRLQTKLNIEVSLWTLKNFNFTFHWGVVQYLGNSLTVAVDYKGF